MADLSYLASFARGEEPRPWNPHDPDDRPFPDCGYLGGVFRAFEAGWSGGPLTVMLTKNPRWVPHTGGEVVVVFLGDEWFRVPAYSGAVLAVLRNLALEPWFPWRTLVPPSATAVAALVNHARLLAERALYLRGSRRLAAREGWGKLTKHNSIDLPLGYYRQPERPLRPWDERTAHVYFGGSLIHDTGRGARWKRGLKQLFGNPKQHHRRTMLKRLGEYARSHPELNANVSVSGDFHGLDGGKPDSYADGMMDARIALVPRGTAAESYRLFEAWRYGCVPVCETLPPRPFYEGAPRVELRSWNELGEALDALLADPARQRALHECSLAWWRERCAENVVGRELVTKLETVRRSGLSARRRTRLRRPAPA